MVAQLLPISIVSSSETTRALSTTGVITISIGPNGDKARVGAENSEASGASCDSWQGGRRARKGRVTGGSGSKGRVERRQIDTTPPPVRTRKQSHLQHSMPSRNLRLPHFTKGAYM